MKVAITTSSFAQYSDKPLQLLREKNIEPVLNPHGRALTEDEAITLLQGCIGVAAGTEPLTAKVMDAVPGLKVISRCGVGMDSVDLAAAKERGITVCNTPDGPTLAVVELTLGYALDLVRNISWMDREIRAGVWKKRMGNLLAGKRVGIIGFGRIGQRVAQAFLAMGCAVSFYDPFLSASPLPQATQQDLASLLATCDIISLHCAKPKDKSLVLNADQIASMKKGALLINAARGGIIDEEALFTALSSNALAGAALDVFNNEPYTGPLTTLDNVILTPHIGSYAKEARITMETDTIINLLRALNI